MFIIYISVNKRKGLALACGDKDNRKIFKDLIDEMVLLMLDIDDTYLLSLIQLKIKLKKLKKNNRRADEQIDNVKTLFQMQHN